MGRAWEGPFRPEVGAEAYDKNTFPFLGYAVICSINKGRNYVIREPVEMESARCLFFLKPAQMIRPSFARPSRDLALSSCDRSMSPTANDASPGLSR